MSSLKEDLLECNSIEEHVSVHVDLIFSCIAEEYELEFGDVTPNQLQRVEQIELLLTELMSEYVEQNK